MKEDMRLTGTWQALSHEDRRLVNKILIDFVHNGILLDQDAQERAEKLDTEIGDLAREANTNIAEDATKLSFTDSELKGMPADTLSKLTEDTEHQGSHFLTLAYPEIFPAMDNVQSEEVRRQLSMAQGNKAAKNEPLLEKILLKRAELAKLRGYGSFAEYATELQMTKKPATVEKFIDDLIAQIHDKGHAEYE